MLFNRKLNEHLLHNKSKMKNRIFRCNNVFFLYVKQTIECQRTQLKPVFFFIYDLKMIMRNNIPFFLLSHNIFYFF